MHSFFEQEQNSHNAHITWEGRIEYDYLSDDDDNELSELDIIKKLEDMG